MKIYLKLLLAVLLAFALVMGCKKKDKAQLVAPEQAGERGASCQAKNDCGSNLSCIGGSCQPQNFNVEATGKECFIHHCDTIEDCCGDKPVDAPTKCRRRDSVCNPTVLGCPAGDFCTSSDTCGGGTCSGLFCENTFFSCATTANCEQDECDFPIGAGGAGLGTCTLSLASCTSNADCLLTNECTGSGSCNCNNPNYDLSDPICSDPDCDDVCIYKCDEELCQEDNSCEADLDCPTIDRPLCDDGTGECVQCLTDLDCDSTLDETDDEDVCRPEGFCETPCKASTECGPQQDCVDGDCEFVGCKTDRECVLGMFAIEGFGDRRLAVCDIGDDGIGQCKISCEIDNHCPVTHVCQGGVCEYIGCEESADCKAIDGLDNLVPTPDQPWNVTGICMDPPPAE